MSTAKNKATKDAVNATEKNPAADKMELTGGAASQVNKGEQPNPENSNMPVDVQKAEKGNYVTAVDVLKLREDHFAALNAAKERAIGEALERHYADGGAVGLPRWKIGTGEDHLYIGNDRVITLINCPSFDITVRKDDEDDEAYYLRLIANNVY